MNERIVPWSNAYWTPTTYAPPSTSALAIVQTAERRIPSNGGRTARIAIASRSIHGGPVRSGKRSSTVWIAFAWISGPDICSLPDVDVECTSCSDGATTPTTTIFPRTALGLKFPSYALTNDKYGTVPGGPV